MPDAPSALDTVHPASPWTSPPPDASASADAWFEQWLNEHYPEATAGRGAGTTAGSGLAIRAAWEKLSPADKTAMLTQLKSMAASGNDPYQIVQFVQQKAAEAASGKSTAAAPTQATVGGLTTGSSGQPSTGTTPLATGTPVQGTNAALQLIQGYMTSPLQQGVNNDPQDVAAAAGIDWTSAQQQYQEYLNNFKIGQSRVKPGFQGGGDVTPMSQTQFVQNLARSQYGRWGPVIGMIAYMWQQQNGSPMPADLAQGINAQLVAFANRDPNGSVLLQQQMLSTLEEITTSAKQASAKGGQATSLNLGVDISSFLTQMSGIAPSVYTAGGSGSSALANASPTSYIGQYIAEHPSVSGEAAATLGGENKAAIDFLTAQQMPTTQANVTALSNPQTLSNMEAYVSWMQGVGMKITPDVLAQLMTLPFGAPSASTTPPAGTGGAFLLSQKVPGSSMNYGAYSTAQSMLGSQWEEYFGRAPTMSELQWSIGQTPQDIQNFIYNSPSKVSGLTIGKYQDYSNEIQNVQGDLPVSASDDFMSSLHQAVTKK